MKKLLIATVLAGFTVSAQAEGWYVQGDLGYSNLEYEGIHVISDFTQRISAGYDWGNWRAAIDYTNVGKLGRSVSNEYASAKVSAKITSLGISTFYNFYTDKQFTPYIGGRLSYNELKATVSINGRYSATGKGKVKGSVSGVGLLGGVQYEIHKNIDLNLGIEYNRPLRLSEETHQVGANIGLRYNF
ncbi:opacity protein-like surface antigen [Nicoletella semolina]|uniref:Opacity protein-like surface antigen n=1 Tax=Nicoletella semolina TaxID=271160 RepID=A0A4R2N8P7_9PAST|nr:opacity family porin [Nicoletella semolina]MDH2924512.1 hypothetical protein [Nicoletella semolina]TCP17360.1 opacity protein-like surface antigen [Nicoletella semolina]